MTPSPAKRGRERPTFRRWAAVWDDHPDIAELGFRTRQEVKDKATACDWRDYRIVRVTVTVDPPRRRAGKAGRR